jgi:RNA polymerase sigma-70 factor (ECF subfamily)
MAELVHVDRALARRILGGDEDAFRELFDRFFPRLYRFALARLPGDPEAARDAVQQTFCQAIERLDTYRGEAALYT